MERKEFIITVVTAAGLMPLAVAQIGCATATGPSAEADAYLYTSSIDGGHSHTVEVKFADLDTPPEGGRTLATSSSGHGHSVTLSFANFLALEAGETVIRETTSSGGHLHTFSFSVAAGDQNRGDGSDY